MDGVAQVTGHASPESAGITPTAALTFLGQSGFRLEWGRDVIYIDPYLSDSVNRMIPETGIWRRRFPPPVRPDEVTDAAWVVCTHEHLDHLDPDTLTAIAAASPGAHFLLPEACRDLALSYGLDGGRLELARGEHDAHSLGAVQVTAVPAAHSRDYTLEVGDYGQRWLGYVLEVGGCRIYHSGDTVVYDGQPEAVTREGKIDIALLPVNGRDAFREAQDIVGNLWPREAVDLATELGARVLIPTHFDVFDYNGIRPGQVADYAFERQLPIEVRVLVAGGATQLLTELAAS